MLLALKGFLCSSHKKLMERSSSGNGASNGTNNNLSSILDEKKLIIKSLSSSQENFDESLGSVCCIATQIAVCGRKDKWAYGDTQGWEVPTICCLFWCCCPFFIATDSCLSLALCCYSAKNKIIGSEKSNKGVLVYKM